jgi:hypothetical protein
MARFKHDSEAQRALAHAVRPRDIKAERFRHATFYGVARPHVGPDRKSRYTAPKNWAERAYPKLIYYNNVDKGGHFVASELFVAELREATSGSSSSPPS